MTRPWEVADYEASLQSWRPAWSDLVAELQPYQKEDLTEDQQATISKVLVASSKSFDWKMILDLYDT
ncbi:MAG TPA: hypothetical protein EYP98_05275, partial [Planctomycetes bacterium]|nr:hypothetical protein [Planctomycetota bacterium]